MHTPALTVELNASRQLTGLLGGLHLVSAAALLLADLDGLLVTALLLLLCASLVYQLRRFAWLLLPQSVIRLIWQDGQMRLLRRDGSEETVYILPDSTVWLHLQVLRLQGSAGVERVIIMPDMAAQDVLRQLRVLLRHATARQENADKSLLP